MLSTIQLKTIKKYKKGNITAAFGADLFVDGVTAISNLLLKLYKQLGITDTEMMLIIQLFRLRTEEKNYLPSSTLLNRFLSTDELQIQENIDSLMQKEILKITEYYDAEKSELIKGFDFEPLFEKLSELWACAKVRENEKIKNAISVNATYNIDLYKGFEKEFGRPLSPMEVEQITRWSQKIRPNLVLEALRRAVLMGKLNFKYIDGILLEWEKNNISCDRDLKEYDLRYQLSQAGKRKNNYQVAKNKQDNSDSSKKNLIKSLYMN